MVDRPKIEIHGIIPGASVQDLVDYGRQQAHKDLMALIRSGSLSSAAQTAFVLGSQETVAVTAGGGTTRLAAVTGTSTYRKRAGVMARQDIAAETGPTIEIAEWAASDSGMAAVPFETDGTSVYQIGVRNQDYPARATLKNDGAVVWDTYRNGIGYAAPGTAIAEHSGAGNGLRITIAHASIQPWADGSTRPVRAWYQDPATGGPVVTSPEALYDGVLSSNGTIVYVDVPHYFGQDPGSYDATVAAYTVMVHGLSIAKKATLDLTGVLTQNIRQYLVLAEWAAATATISYLPQTIVPSLQGLWNLVPPNFSAVARAGAWLGGWETTRDFNWPLNLTYATGGDPVTITFPAWTGSEHFIFTGDSASGLSPVFCFSVVSNVASFATALASGRYVVYVKAVPDPSLPGEYLAEYAVTLEAGTAGAFAKEHLLLLAFDWDTVGKTITNESFVDLSKFRGWLDPRSIGTGTDAGGLGQHVEELIGTETLDILLRAAPATLGDFATGKAARFSKPDDDTWRLTVGAHDANLATGESVEVQHGGPTGWATAAENIGGTESFFVRKQGGSSHVQVDAAGGKGGGAAATSGLARASDLGFLAYKLVATHTDVASRSSGDIIPVKHSELIYLDQTRPASTTLPVAADGVPAVPARSVQVGDLFVWKLAAEITGYTAGDQFDFSVQAFGTSIFSSVGIDPGAVGKVLALELHIYVEAIGSTGAIRVARYVSGNGANLYQTPPGTLGYSDLTSSIAVDLFTGPSTGAWSAGGYCGFGTGEITLVHSEIVRYSSARGSVGNAPDRWATSGGWYWNPEHSRMESMVGGPAPGYRLMVALDVRAVDPGAANSIEFVTAVCGMDAAGAADTIAYGLYTRHRTTGVLTGPIAGTSGSQTGSGAVTITPTTPLVVGEDAIPFVGFVANNGEDGTTPRFWVASVRHTERFYRVV